MDFVTAWLECVLAFGAGSLIAWLISIAAVKYTSEEEAIAAVSAGALPPVAGSVNATSQTTQWPNSGSARPAPGQFWPTTPSKRRRGRWLAAVTAVLLAALAATGTALYVRSQHRPGPVAEPTPSAPTRAAAAPPVSPSALRALLPPAQQVADISGAPAMIVGASGELIPKNIAAVVAEKECITTWTSALESTYANTGFNGARTEVLFGKGEPASQGKGESSQQVIVQNHLVTQAVIGYPSAEMAQKIVANQLPQWTACAGRTVTVISAAGEVLSSQTFGPLAHDADALVITSKIKGSPAFTCQHALAARSNVVIDVQSCRFDGTNQAVDTLNAIAAKIPH